MYPSACQRQRCGPTQVNARPIGHLPRARVVVLGASGNSGTSLLRALAYDHQVSSVLAVSRRRAALELPKTDWAQADIAEDELTPLFRGADAVVHLAWLIQPSRDEQRLWRTNVEGSTRLFRAVAETGVPALAYASSVGAYAKGRRMAGRREPADARHPLELLLAQQGRGRAPTRPIRARASRSEGGAGATWSDLQARGGLGHPAPVRRPVPSEPAVAGLRRCLSCTTSPGSLPGGAL
jgi:uncharacterized protein YbjT (DUF2867 family)